MANEISLAITLTARKNGANFSQSLSQASTMAGDEMLQSVQDIGTSSEAVSLVDVSTVGYVLVQNLDTTNFVELSVDNANAQKFAKLLPGDLTLVKASAAFYAKADTAICKLLVLALEI